MNNLNRMTSFIFWCSVLLITNGNADFRGVILGDRTGDADPAVFSSILNEIQVIQPDFMINVGDLIEGPQPDETAIHRQWDLVQDALKILACPIYYAPGNNDIFNEISRKIYTERTGQQRYYSFDYQSIHFIVLDNSTASDWDEMGTDQLEWLEKNLLDHKTAPVTCLFIHKPFWYDTFQMNESNRMHDLFVKYGVDWVFSGHFHRYVSAVRDGIHYVMVGSSGGHLGSNEAHGDFYQYGYLTLKNGKLQFSLIKAGSILPMDFLTIEKSQQHDQYEEMFCQMASVTIDDANSTPLSGQIQFSKKMGSISGRYTWHIDGTPWTIQPAYGSYSITDSDLSVSFQSALHGSSLYPLPVLTIQCPMADGTEYPLRIPMNCNRRHVLKKSATTPQINGLLDETVWSDGLVISDWGSEDGGVSSIEPTSIRLLRDDAALYLGVDATESRMPEANIVGTDRDNPVFQGDCIFFMFWSSETPCRLTQMIINPNGVVFDRQGIVPATPLKDPPELDQNWNGNVSVASGMSSNGWRLEIKIPFTEIGLTHDSEQFHLNLIRYQSRFNESSSWIYPATYEKEHAGLIIMP